MKIKRDLIDVPLIKKSLFDHFKTHLEKKIKALELLKTSLQKELTSETKSSAGDKFETTRAMIQWKIKS